jgi:hypothetical protein
VRVNVELQDDFSLNQQLSLFVVDTVRRLDRENPEYPRLVLALVEAVLEDPGVILLAQVSKLKERLVAELKAEGVEYEARMDRLQEVEHPKPYRDWIYNLFNEFAAQHPWVGRDNIQPKSIGLEMFDRYMTFQDYIRDYGLQRAEGILLRHLSNLYKTLTQTVPETHWTDEVEEMILYFEGLVRGTDSSILDEWEHLRDPNYVAAETKANPIERLRPKDITRDRKALERLSRAAIYRVLRTLALAHYQDAAAELAQLAGRPEEDAAPPPLATADLSTVNEGRGPFEWHWEALERAFEPYWSEHTALRLDPPARSALNTRFEDEPREPGLRVEQTLVDPDEHNDWSLVFHLDLEATRAAGEPRMTLQTVGAIGGG